MSIEKKEEKKKPNWERRVFWLNLIMQIVLFIIVLKSGEVYPMAYKFAHVFLIVLLINTHTLVKSSNYWEKMYTDLLDEQIKEDKESEKENE